MTCHSCLRDQFLRESDSACRILTEDFPQPETVAVLRSVTSGLDLMLSSEDYFRAGERRQELGIDPGGAQLAFTRAVRLNDAARTIFDDTLPTGILRLRERLAANGPVDTEPYVVLFDDLAREKIAGLGINVYQTRKAREILEQGMEAARAGGEAACDLMADGVRQLSELRAARSMRNDPVTAVCAIVAAGLAALVMALAAAPGGPTPTTWWVVVLFLMLLTIAGASAVASLSALPWAAAAA